MLYTISVHWTGCLKETWFSRYSKLNFFNSIFDSILEFLGISIAICMQHRQEGVGAWGGGVGLSNIYVHVAVLIYM